MDSIFHRRSIRQYTDEPVTKEQISQILRAAMAAPSACDDRQWEFYVVTNPEVKNKLAETSPYASAARKAPVDLVVAYRAEHGFAPEYGQINSSIACQNIMLKADELGLGSVMLGVAPEADRMKYVKEVLNMQGDLEPFAIIPIGHPAITPKVRETFDDSKIHVVE